MTADLNEGESGPPNPSSGFRFQGEVDVRLSDQGRPKGGRRKEVKEIELRQRLGDEGLGKDCRETADLTTHFEDDVPGRQRAVNHDAAVQGMGRGEVVPFRESRKIVVLSSDGFRDEETEDDFGEGDGAVPEVASQPKAKQQQEHAQQSRDQTHKTPWKEPQQQGPLSAQAPASSVGWESFLPQRNIRVLLAEDDDSTRQVVGALLRNCSYEDHLVTVTEPHHSLQSPTITARVQVEVLTRIVFLKCPVSSVSNGMQAWEMLEDPSNHFDLVLTDVVMPCLSGVGLLSKIMSNELGKRIPVIMMSSHDSLDIVFRCLSKGAADFLVKPVRKNELKNLWQHVWRCQSSSGSGSGGSGSGNGKVARPKSKVGSGNNTGSNDGSDDNSSGLNVRGGSDNGSGTQAVVHMNHKQKREKPDSKESQATSLEKLSDHRMGQDLEMATRRPPALDKEEGPKDGNQGGVDGSQDASPSTSGNSGNKRSNSATGKAIDLIGGIANQNNEEVDDAVESGDGMEGSDRGASNSPVNDKCVTSSKSPPRLELSLKRPRAPGEDNNSEKRVLRHSGGSAFSRYSTNGTTIQQIPCGTPLSLSGYPVGSAYGTHSLSPLPGPLGVGNALVHFPTPIDRAGSSKGSGEASNIPMSIPPRASHKGNGQDLGSSVVGSSIPEGYSQQVKDEGTSVSPMSGQGLPIPMSLPPRGVLYESMSAAYGPAMQVFYSHSSAPRWASGGSHFSDRGQVFDHPPYHDHGSHPAHQSILHSSHHRQQQSHHHSRLLQPSLHSQQDGQVITNQASGAPGCGSSNMQGSVPDGNTGQSGSSNGYGSTGNGNGSVNGSGSGSNNVNHQNGQSGVVVNPSENGDCAGMNGTGCGGPGNGVEHEQNRYTRREAALNKFRQKRKERCFEKKVRYQSRKRLAEQRPRVRGQFVRQAIYDPNGGSEMPD